MKKKTYRLHIPEHTEVSEETGETITIPEVDEQVELERWAWGVLYDDDTQLHQYQDADKSFHRVAEIEQDRIKAFVLYQTGPGQTGRIDIAWRPGMKLIHRYRKAWLDVGTPDKRFVKVYMFGYRIVEDGKARYHVNYVLPDNRIVQSTDPDLNVTAFGL